MTMPRDFDIHDNIQNHIVDDMDALVEVLPDKIRQRLLQIEGIKGLLEVVLDLGRPPECRLPGNKDVTLLVDEVSEQDIDHVVQRVGVFGGDNRAGIPRTLHRISAIRNRAGKIIGLTCRVGRAVYGTVRMVQDLMASDKNILLLGRPGVGKTTMLREMARVLADESHKRVIIVDTSNEIAGDGDIPHPAIGHARRMQVAKPTLQHDVMIEAVENHMPEAIIIDEMGTELEASAARTIAERGVQLIGTAHGNTLENLVMNPTLCDLIGGIQTVTLGDDEARRRGTQKSILERKAPPTFDIVVEIKDQEVVAVHKDVAPVVDKHLRGLQPNPEQRWVGEDGTVQHSFVRQERAIVTSRSFQPDTINGAEDGVWNNEVGAWPKRQVPQVFSYGVNRDMMLQALEAVEMPFDLVANLEDAEVILTTKGHYRRRASLLKAAEFEGKPVHVLRKNSVSQIQNFLYRLSRSRMYIDSRDDSGLLEAEDAVQRIEEGEDSIVLTPQSSFVRRMQHLLAEKHQLHSASRGREPNRRVVIYRR